MRAPVVRCRNFDILVRSPPVPFVVLNTEVRKLNVPVVERKAVLTRPSFDLLAIAIGAAATIPPTAVVLLEKALIIALQFLLEHDSAYTGSTCYEALSRPEVRRV